MGSKSPASTTSMVQYMSLDEPASQTSRSRCSSFWWWQELVSVIASFGCIVAVIVILRMVQDKPTDQWTFFISLNATIAALITAAKSTAMLSVAACISQWKWAYFLSKRRRLADLDIIEEASRGPLGSVQMLTTVTWGLGTLGAVVTIVALGIDTFAQQVISNEPVTRWTDDGTASFGLAHSYNGSARTLLANAPGGSGNDWEPDPYTIDSSMQGAVFKAFYDLETPDLFNCTSNCTWDQSYTSLGFSMACTNVTQDTYSTRNCTHHSNGTHTCEMTTPGGVSFSTGEADTMWSTVLVIQAVANAVYFGLNSFSNTGPVPPTFMRFAVFRQPADYVMNDATVEETLECDLSFAAYTYSNVTSVGNDFNFGNVETTPLDNGTFVASGNWNEGSHIVFNTSGLPEFTVSIWDLGALLYFFPSDHFSGKLALGETPAVYSAGITPGVWSPGRNISQVLDKMAVGMTNQLRSTYNANARGLTASSVVLVRVQWPWLALPFAVVLAAAVLLLAEMMESRRSRNISLWKSSSTALLYHSVSPTRDVMSPHVHSPRQLEKLAKSTRVILGVDRQAPSAYSSTLSPIGPM
ncbi:hypothetical protein KVR01_008569 [Diaporthe batatas]|uniref:uncharacterized protein n=1 Tax=Diaporthe batatas TaxID=748121 RepID=UPI001D04D553|nr:uncharacterized protein KVR01_008569 [Diaporthe batatas]KAG8161582.1 hypothetical protein KVR01_008569 [Diaporthe batatas]